MSSVYDLYIDDAKRPTWREAPETYRVHILTTRDDEGTYSTVALNLPGAGSCGDTREESIENAKDAIKAVIESYKQDGDSIPWKDTTREITAEGDQKWIIVNA